MILILGGLASGKRSYAKNVLAYAEADMADAVLDARPVIYNVQDLVAKDPAGSMALIDALAAKEVVIVNEVGSGVIPMDRHERESREVTGRLTIVLAQRASKVVRMVAGLPGVIKE